MKGISVLIHQTSLLIISSGIFKHEVKIIDTLFPGSVVGRVDALEDNVESDGFLDGLVIISIINPIWQLEKYFRATACKPI